MAITAFKVIEVGTNRKPVCDFLLVINSITDILSRTVSELSQLSVQISLHAVTLLKISGTRGHLPSIIFARIVRPINALQICRWQFSHTCYGGGATSENRAKIDDFAPTRSLWSKISGTRGRPQPIIFARLVRPVNALQICHWQFSHKETLLQTFFKRSAFFTQIGRFAFLRPPLGVLGATHNDHLRLIGKHIVDFLLALIELFSLDVTAETLRAIMGSKSAILLQRGPVDPKFQVEGIAPHQPFFLSENYAKCSFVWCINLDRPFYRLVTKHAFDRRTDRQTDGQTEFSSLDRVCIACSAVKTGQIWHWPLTLRAKINGSMLGYAHLSRSLCLTQFVDIFLFLILAHSAHLTFLIKMCYINSLLLLLFF